MIIFKIKFLNKRTQANKSNEELKKIKLFPKIELKIDNEFCNNFSTTFQTFLKI